jgi:hypothetical protein
LPDRRQGDSPAIVVLEWVTAAVLVLVLGALAWMAAADRLPPTWRPLTLEGEILGVLGLLTAALLFVSVLALLHTRATPR